MRDFIFRAFDKVDNKMYHHFDMPDKYILTLRGEIWDLGPGYGVGHIMRDRFELMQFTGLKDKNGVEIYEGDIIEHERRSRPYSDKAKKANVRCIVTWYDGKSDGGTQNLDNPRWMARPIKDNEESRWGYAWSEFHDCEVIGNIHEHKYLLE